MSSTAGTPSSTRPAASMAGRPNRAISRGVASSATTVVSISVPVARPAAVEEPAEAAA